MTSCFGSLDTFPYAGTTTTCESLYMGVPCVTMAGSVHAHNVGVSLLTRVGKNIYQWLNFWIHSTGSNSTNLFKIKFVSEMYINTTRSS